MTKLTDDELALVRKRATDQCWITTRMQEDRAALLSHIDAITNELSQAQADVERSDAALDEANATIEAYKQATACLGQYADDMTPEAVAKAVAGLVDEWDEARGRVIELEAELAALRATLAATRSDIDWLADDLRKVTRPEWVDNLLARIDAAAPQPPAQEDHSHAARLNRLLGILRRLKWAQNEEATMLSPAGPADALNDLGLFMFSDAIDRAAEVDRLEREGTS